MDAATRKQHPMATGFLDYFPNAMMEVAHLSKVGNDQHNPGQPLHWDKTKSMDHPDALLRHLKDRGTRDTDGERHSAKVAWRAMAMLEMEILNEQGEPSAMSAIHDYLVGKVMTTENDNDKILWGIEDDDDPFDGLSM